MVLRILLLWIVLSDTTWKVQNRFEDQTSSSTAVYFYSHSTAFRHARWFLFHIDKDDNIQVCDGVIMSSKVSIYPQWRWNPTNLRSFGGCIDTPFFALQNVIIFQKYFWHWYILKKFQKSIVCLFLFTTSYQLINV